MSSQPNFIGAQTSWVDAGDETRAFLAVPRDRTGPFPAVIIGHERYGLVQHTLDLAAKFASCGYACIAPDMASHWEGDRAALTRGDVGLTLSDEEVQQYYSLGLDYLKALPSVNGSQVAAMGVCQSGGYPLLLNGVRSDVSANIVVYGGTRTPESVIAAGTAPILGIFGEADHTISVEDVDAFRATLQRHNRSYEITLYPGMPHGWLNDTMPGRYRQPEAEQAWSQIISFLERVNGGAYPPKRVRWSWCAEMDADYDFSKNVRLA